MSEQTDVQEIVDNVLINGIICESESNFARSVLLVRIKDVVYRICLTYRELNAHTIKDRNPLPLTQDQLDRLRNGVCFLYIFRHVIRFSLDSYRTRKCSHDGFHDS